MTGSKWFLVPALCAAIAFGTASSALAAGKHHAAKPAAGKTVKKPVAMSSTHAKPRKHKQTRRKKTHGHKPAACSTKDAVPKNVVVSATA